MSENKHLTLEKDPAAFIKEFIKSFVAESPENKLHLIDDSPIWEEPLVGFADGEDPLFYEYKKIIGDFHLTPREILEKTFAVTNNSIDRELSNISVICWALPVAKRTVQSNAKRDNWPSLRWAHTRQYGEMLNGILRRELASLLTAKGYFAVAPFRSPLYRHIHGPRYPRQDSGDPTRYPTSNWSERHALYVAGMGTFGLHDGLITSRGTAIRAGSVVVNMKIPPTPRPYNSPYKYCPFFTDKSCGMCIDRCPTGAIGINGHDKIKCDMYGHVTLAQCRVWYEVERFGCALCMTGVPCTSKIPPKA